MRRTFQVLMALFVFPLAASPVVQAQQSLEGKRVVVIRDKAPLEVSGKEVAKAAECTVFTVKSVQGSFLWIESEKAYLRRSDVVPFEDAIAHYTRLLETNKTANNYWNRAQIWRLKGELDIALGDMNDAIRLNPNESVWFHNRGVVWASKKDFDKAIADYSEAIRLDGTSGETYAARSRAWLKKQNYDKAIADCDEALKHISHSEKIHILTEEEVAGGDSTQMVSARAMALSKRGDVWRDKGSYDKAIADYEEAIRLDPTFVFLRLNRGYAFELKHEYDKALADFEEVIRLNPKVNYPRSRRRAVWRKKGEWDKIAAEWEAVVKEGSPTAATFNELAWLRATCPVEKYRNGSQAVECATKACELSAWKEANWIDTLAAAYAEAGNFDKAVEWQKKGMDLAPAEQKADFESRLKLYQEKKPYHQSAPQ